MIAVDTDILIYAHRAETELHEAAARELVALAEGTAAWGLPVFVPHRAAGSGFHEPARDGGP